MRFGAHIKVSRHAPWAEFYCDYERLKNLIESADREAFETAWREELAKVSAFFFEQWAELMTLIYLLVGKAESLEFAVERLSAADLDAIRKNDALLVILHSFAEDNFAALRKSVKKFDKIVLKDEQVKTKRVDDKDKTKSSGVNKSGEEEEAAGSAADDDEASSNKTGAIIKTTDAAKTTDALNRLSTTSAASNFSSDHRSKIFGNTAKALLPALYCSFFGAACGQLCSLAKKVLFMDSETRLVPGSSSAYLGSPVLLPSGWAGSNNLPNNPGSFVFAKRGSAQSALAMSRGLSSNSQLRISGRGTSQNRSMSKIFAQQQNMLSSTSGGGREMSSNTIMLLGQHGQKPSPLQHSGSDRLKAEINWLYDTVANLDEVLANSLVGHRGFHSSIIDTVRPVENSLPAYELIWSAGLIYCECDVVCTRDGKIILNHDMNLKRLALMDSPQNGPAFAPNKPPSFGLSGSTTTGTGKPSLSGAVAAAVSDKKQSGVQVDGKIERNRKKELKLGSPRGFAFANNSATTVSTSGSRSPNATVVSQTSTNNHSRDGSTSPTSRAEERAQVLRQDVSELSFRQIVKTPLRSGVRPPLLTEVLHSAAAISDDARLVIELKYGTEIANKKRVVTAGGSCASSSSSSRKELVEADKQDEIQRTNRNRSTGMVTDLQLVKSVGVIMSFDLYAMGELAKLWAAEIQPMTESNQR
eukprot:g15276.t1